MTLFYKDGNAVDWTVNVKLTISMSWIVIFGTSIEILLESNDA